MERPGKNMLSRMPLAEAVLLLWNWVVDEDRLQNIWEASRGACYEKIISFPLMVHLVADAVLKYEGSGRRSFEKNIENGELEASIKAAYGKLGRLPIPVSQALLTECTGALREAFPEWAEWQLPESLQGFHVVILDGKTIKRVAKRLKPLRGVPGGMLGGRALVAMEWSTGLAVAMHAHPDGDASDVRFVGDLVPVVREQLPGPRLWLADAAFCDLDQPGRFTSVEGDRFLVRYHPKVKFHRDEDTPIRKGKTANGQAFTEQWGWLGSPRDKRRRYVRMIRLICPDKDRDVILVTDLLDADRYPAMDLLWLYSERWGIENMFQKVTEVFGLSGLIGGTPQSCIFQFSFCLLLYNMIQVVRGYIAEGQDREPNEISTEKLFDDIEQQLIAWNVMFSPEITLNYFDAPLTSERLQARLTQLLGGAWSATWEKSPQQLHHRKTPRKRVRTHKSVYRILRDHSRKTQKQSARSP